MTPSPPTPAISVVTPTYNRRDSVLRAVRSVLSQTCTDFEHIIVDDGSTDGTAEALQALSDDRIVLLRLPERQGANAARNLGIEWSRAPIVTFLDSDDVFLPDRLRGTIKQFDADPGLELLISSFITVRGSRETACINRQAYIDSVVLERALVLQTIFIAGSAITARRSSILEIGAFDPSFSRMQDREFLLRFAQRCGAALKEKIDWRKYASADSISGQVHGYVAAYEKMIGKHRPVREKYPAGVRYILARQLFRTLTKGYFSEALSGLRINRSSQILGYPVRELIWSLVMDRRRRREFRDLLRVGGLQGVHREAIVAALET